MERERDDYIISTERERLDLGVVHEFLGSAYWSPGMPLEVVERSLENSLLVGLFAPDGAQVGLARVLNDRDALVYLADVFVREGHSECRQWLVETMLSHPELAGMRATLLADDRGHSLYVLEPAESAQPPRPERLGAVAGRPGPTAA